jgi:isoleucyl-tRNA synthetase
LVITDKLKSEGISREVIRHIQSARKNAGLNIDDRIQLILITDDNELKKSIKAHAKLISDETLATKLSDIGSNNFTVIVKIDGVDLTISLQKS